MSVIEITSSNQFNELINKTPYVAIQAHAEWCGPCKAISPMFAKHAGDLTNDKYVFAKFDTDALADLAKELDIRSIPAFFIFKNGDKVDTLAGANPPALQKLTATYAEKSQSELSTNEDF